MSFNAPPTTHRIVPEVAPPGTSSRTTSHENESNKNQSKQTTITLLHPHVDYWVSMMRNTTTTVSRNGADC